MKSPLRFTIEKRLGTDTLGRAGVLETPHGTIQTPAFVTVGTKATVKSLTPEQLRDIGVQVVLANTYHLYLEPGEALVAEAGGLHKFMNWSGPMMTDSGGFQVFSLGADYNKKLGKFGIGANNHSNILQNVGMSEDRKRRSDVLENIRISGEGIPLAKIDEDGVTFKSVLDGGVHRFTPERSMEIQNALGADMIFAFDECTSPEASYEYQKEALARTHRWADRSLAHHKKLQAEKKSEAKFPSSQIPPFLKGVQLIPMSGGFEIPPASEGSAPFRKGRMGEDMHVKERKILMGQGLFGIVQGGRFADLRQESARKIGGMELARGGGGFDGFGLGGSFNKEDVSATVALVNGILPEEKPRHLLGIGEPEDLFAAVASGCDLFDCVAPTRQARNGSLYTRGGKINITNSKFVRDFFPIDSGCLCYTCKNFTRAYVAHLFRAHELLANTLASIHNLFFITHLVADMRRAILDGNFREIRDEFLSQYE